MFGVSVYIWILFLSVVSNATKLKISTVPPSKNPKYLSEISNSLNCSSYATLNEEMRRICNGLRVLSYGNRDKSPITKRNTHYQYHEEHHSHSEFSYSNSSLRPYQQNRPNYTTIPRYKPSIREIDRRPTHKDYSYQGAHQMEPVVDTIDQGIAATKNDEFVTETDMIVTTKKYSYAYGTELPHTIRMTKPNISVTTPKYIPQTMTTKLSTTLLPTTKMIELKTMTTSIPVNSTTVKPNLSTMKPKPTTIQPTNSTTQPVNNTTEKVEVPCPIMVTIVPDVTEIIGSDGETPNLSCEVSGTNLKSLGPYVLSWYERENAGVDAELNSKHNATRIAFKKALTVHDLNHEVYCALKFNVLAPTVFAKMSSAYIKITRIKKSPMDGSLVDASSQDNSQDWIIGGATIAVVLLVCAGVAFILIRHRVTQTDISQRRPSELHRPSVTNRDSGIYETPDEQIYSYVPIQVVPFYEAKAMAAANQRVEMQTIRPPPLPERPPNMRNADDYDYAYGYDRRPSRPI